MPKFINTTQAAKQLNITIRQVARLCKSGAITAQKIGTGARSVYIIDAAEFRRFKSQRRSIVARRRQLKAKALLESTGALA